MRLYSEAWSLPTWSTFPSFTSTLSHISGMQILGGGKLQLSGKEVKHFGGASPSPPSPPWMKPCLCLPVAMLTVTRHHQFPIPPCSCYKAHCCKASPVPFASSLVNRPLTNHMQHWVYYITSTRWEGVWPRAYRARACNSRTSCIEGDTPLVWHNAHTKLVLVQEKLHQLCGQLWLARSDPQQYVIYGVYVHYMYA